MKLSVIIPAYQHGREIGACLESILAQTRPADEIIVVNDGSTDATSDVLQPFEGRIQVIEQENRGGNPARMRGFEQSTGELIIFCDADILMKPAMLARMEHALVEHPEASFAYSSFRFGWKRFACFPYDAQRLRQMNYIHTTSLIRRAHFPGFDPGIHRLQDWDVWLTMLEGGHIGTFVPDELFSVQTRARKGISQWQPSFLYRLPWERFGWMPATLRSYAQARDALMRKHGL